MMLAWCAAMNLVVIMAFTALAALPISSDEMGPQDKGRPQKRFADACDPVRTLEDDGAVNIVVLAAVPTPPYLSVSSADTATAASEPPTGAPADSMNSGDAKDAVLAGDGGGLRPALSKSGVDTEIVYKFDVVRNTTGGAKIGTTTLNNLDVKFSLDGEKLLGSRGTTALVYFLSDRGGRPGAALVDNAEGVDNIEVANRSVKLYQAWIQQNFMQDRLSVLAGLYDLNSEFYVTESSGLFLRPTFGIGTDMSQSGRTGPSIFPVASAGVRVKIQPDRNFIVQGALLDGVAGDPNDPKGTHIRWNHHDGALITVEADYLPGGEARDGKIGVGAWRYTEKIDDLTDTDAFGNPIQRPSDGMYVLFERRIYRAAGRDDQGLTIFARAGVADGDVNRFDYSWSSGAVYTGLFGREKGQLGLGVEGAHNSRKYRASSDSATDASTMAYELTYSDNLTPWLSVQPDVQYIVDPDTKPALRNSLVVGTRFTVKF